MSLREDELFESMVRIQEWCTEDCAEVFKQSTRQLSKQIGSLITEKKEALCKPTEKKQKKEEHEDDWPIDTHEDNSTFLMGAANVIELKYRKGEMTKEQCKDEIFKLVGYAFTNFIPGEVVKYYREAPQVKSCVEGVPKSKGWYTMFN